MHATRVAPRPFVPSIIGAVLAASAHLAAAEGGRVLHGERDGVRVQSALPAESRMVLGLLGADRAPGSGAGLSTFCEGDLCSIQALYRDPVEGNGVLLLWKESSLHPAGVTVVMDGEALCEVPGLPAEELPGYNLCLVSGLPESCLPESANDPGCPSLPLCALSQRPADARLFEVVASGELVGQTCQEVISDRPMAREADFCFRAQAAPNPCAFVEEKYNPGFCDLELGYEDGDIIVTGGNTGPPSSFFQIEADDDGLTVSRRLTQANTNIFCFERKVHVETRGPHRATLYGFVNREDAASLFWLDQQSGEGYDGLVGAFAFSVVETLNVSTGRAPAPRDLLLRQTAYEAGAGKAVRASWTNPVAYEEVRLYVDDLAGAPRRVLDGTALDGSLGSLPEGDRRIGVQGDAGSTGGGESRVADRTIRLLAASPHTTPISGDLVCSHDPGRGSTTVSWTLRDPSDVIDVTVARSPEPILVATLPGDATSVTVPGVTASDRIQVQFFAETAGHLHGSPVYSCGAGASRKFIRGLCNGVGGPDPDITSAIFGLSFLFTGGAEPPCVEACDTNEDGSFDISDMVALLGILFLGGPAPSAWVAGAPTCEPEGPGDDCEAAHGVCP